MAQVSKKQPSLFEQSHISAYDLATLDKLPVIQELMAADGEGLALDIGIGTGYTTRLVFGAQATVCLDLHAPNLLRYREKVASAAGAHQPLCVVAPATSLPFKEKSFRYVLCSEVLEHLEDDDRAVGEIARVLADDGKAVITVPYSGLGFSSFLELCGIKTVHDFPGPEYHVRPGYDEQTLRTLLARHGLQIERQAYYFRFFTRLLADMVSLAHLLYQRIVHRRRAWTWSEAAASENSLPFRIYTWLFPILRSIAKLDRLLGGRRGFGLVVVIKKYHD